MQRTELAVTNRPERRLLLTALLIAALVAVGHGAHAHDIPAPRGPEEPPTRFERFLLDGCSPCVKEAHSVATIQIPPQKLTVLPRMGSSPMTRAGEIGFEVLRAYQLGRPSREYFAIRVTLSVPGGVGGGLFRIAVGLLDEEQVPALASLVSEMAQVMAAAPAGPGPENTDLDFHGGSVRIGLIRRRSDTLSYVQAGDMRTLVLRPPWEVSENTYLPLPADQVPILANTVGQLAARIQTLRGHQGRIAAPGG